MYSRGQGSPNHQFWGHIKNIQKNTGSPPKPPRAVEVAHPGNEWAGEGGGWTERPMTSHCCSDDVRCKDSKDTINWPHQFAGIYTRKLTRWKKNTIFNSKVVSTHRTGTHPENQPLPTGYNSGIPIHNWRTGGISPGVCEPSGCVIIFLEGCLYCLEDLTDDLDPSRKKPMVIVDWIGVFWDPGTQMAWTLWLPYP